MGVLDLFRRGSRGGQPPVETRSSGTGYTASIMAAREAWISGASGMAELTAAVQTSVSLWESGLSLADVTGTDLLDRRTMAIIARALALRGECVFLVRDRLIPATDWDVSTRNGIPRAYRLGIPEIGGGRRETVLAPEVLHFRIGCDASTPWAGSAPLRRAQLSAQLLHELETALRDVFKNAPLGSQIVPVPEGSADDMEQLRAGFRGRRGAALVIEGTAQATAAGMNPQIGQHPDQLSPHLDKTLADKLLADAKGAIYGTFGILPGLMNPATTGPMVREAQRHLAQLVLQPIANLLAEEASEKIGLAVKIDCVRPMQLSTLAARRGLSRRCWARWPRPRRQAWTWRRSRMPSRSSTGRTDGIGPGCALRISVPAKHLGLDGECPAFG
ncbi:MAG: phage portal protein [Paracoccus sp. (in: a-proteobacteria)]|uniref:phage portal protein n=1 Tax=Paracoccus sp. TaxID=267 RepID=UPI0040591E1A|tara:strand:- start:1118 stop:2281 length:1164 start_codon:yes stop_codon:yes gene_type:complete